MQATKDARPVAVRHVERFHAGDPKPRLHFRYDAAYHGRSARQLTHGG